MHLDVSDLHVSADEKEIIKGVSLSVRSGEFHVLMGPNGSGKTTLIMAIMGYPKLKIKSGDIKIDGKSIISMSADKRAQLGLFLQMQNPTEIEGVGLVNFLVSAKSAIEQNNKIQFRDLMNEIKQAASKLNMQNEIIGRSLNYGLSGGEKKKSEILQMLVLKPKIAILDEPDSGLDVDAVKDVANVIDSFSKESGAGILLITHYTRILRYLHPGFVHVMIGGEIVKSGGPELAEEIEKNGYQLSKI